MRILALDPGPQITGWAIMDGRRLHSAGVLPNDELLFKLESPDMLEFMLAIEMIASYGMAVGAEVFETCVWIGRFQQAWHTPKAVLKVFRQQVKQRLCASVKAKDANVRAAIIDLFPRTGAGAVPQIGTKKNPGPLFGVSTHAWPALGVAITVNPEFNDAAVSPHHVGPSRRRVQLLKS